jgi:hypothetical protein
MIAARHFVKMVIPLTPVTPTYSVLGYGKLSKESDGI